MNPPGSRNGLDDWLRWLETLSPNEIDLGLERVTEVLDRLELARPGRVITVAGTNGKGSTVVMIEALLSAAGENVASYTSPHIHEFNERIRSNGTAASDEDIVTAFQRVEAARQDAALTYFEFGTLAALVYFDSVRPDTVILEVGLGGRLDAVNVVDPDACLITNVTLDHCDWLGDDVETIAAEKAGIMRGDTAVVFGSSQLPVAICNAAIKTGADLIVAGRDFRIIETDDGLWNWSGRDESVDGLNAPSLEGRHQLQNASAVLALVESLGMRSLLNAEIINRAFAMLNLPGRLQQIARSDRRYVVDVAHNVDSARVLAEFISHLNDIDRVIAVIGVQRGKDLQGMIGALAPVVNHWIACDAASGNARPADELAQEVVAYTGKPCLVANTVDAALEAARESAKKTDLIVVTGSFYTVGPALLRLNDFRCAH